MHSYPVLLGVTLSTSFSISCAQCESQRSDDCEEGCDSRQTRHKNKGKTPFGKTPSLLPRQLLNSCNRTPMNGSTKFKLLRKMTWLSIPSAMLET
mmetsp:Transcript_39430/g.54955  ORF Transcript_39430/g.54955 Transcript_39430/m.54955 type:complete len:95 (+) Transcript_39430:592-876(+)